VISGRMTSLSGLRASQIFIAGPKGQQNIENSQITQIVKGKECRVSIL